MLFSFLHNVVRDHTKFENDIQNTDGDVVLILVP